MTIVATLDNFEGDEKDSDALVCTGVEGIDWIQRKILIYYKDSFEVLTSGCIFEEYPMRVWMVLLEEGAIVSLFNNHCNPSLVMVTSQL